MSSRVVCPPPQALKPAKITYLMLFRPPEFHSVVIPLLGGEGIYHVKVGLVMVGEGLAQEASRRVGIHLIKK